MSTESMDGVDPISTLTNDCVALIFDCLHLDDDDGKNDRRNCKLVCRSWLAAESRTRRKLSINLENPPSVFPSLFARYSAVSDLTLKGSKKKYGVLGLVSMDKALSHVSLSNLARLRLDRWILTHAGMSAIASNCPRLRSFYCYSGKMIDDRAIAILIERSPLLYHITLHDIESNGVTIGLPSTSLRSIDLNSNRRASFAPLVSCSPNLATLKYHSDHKEKNPNLTNISSSLIKIHLKGPSFADHALFAISSCTNLQTLRVELNNNCTDAGLVAVANNCRLLCKVRMISLGWQVHTVGDKSLTALLTCCPNLRKLHIHGIINLTSRSLDLIATNCHNLEQLILYRIPAFGDAELSSIAANCNSLKILRIIYCSISQHGIKAIANGCPNLILETK